METASILAQLALLTALFYKRGWVRFHWLTMIGILGLVGTPLLHHVNAHGSATSYFYLYYGLDLLSAILYLLSISQLRRTMLESIALSQVLYLGMKMVGWVFLWKRLENCRIVLSNFMLPLNIIFIFVWAVLIAMYSHKRKEPKYDNVLR